MDETSAPIDRIEVTTRRVPIHVPFTISRESLPEAAGETGNTGGRSPSGTSRSESSAYRRRRLMPRTAAAALLFPA